MTTRLSLGAVAGVAFIAAVAVPRSAIPLLDGDVWWHLRAGETVLATGQVPAADTWTIAGQGMRWISQDWLTNTAMAALMRIGGPWGATSLSLAFALLVGLAFWILWRAAGLRLPRAGWLARAAWLTLGLMVAGPIVGVRVQTVDLLMTALTVWVLWAYLADRRARWLLSLPVISVAWVNLHAGWPLLLALIGAVVVGEAVDRASGRRLLRGPLTPRQLLALSAAGVGALMGVAVNPNGIAMYGYPFATASIAAHRDFIFEWSRPDLASFPGQMILVLMLLAVVPTLVIAKRRMPLSDALWLVGLAVMSLTAVRFALLAGPICCLIAAVHLGPWVASRPALASAARTVARMDRVPPGPRGRINLGLAVAMAAVGLVIALARVTPAVQSVAIAEAMPAESTAWVRDHGPAGRIFNVYAWGGYIGRELPDSLVYIDGRSDIYGDGPIQEYADAISLLTDPAPLLDRADIDTVVFWPDAPFAEWLDSHGWRRVHEDAVAAVWQRGSARR